MTRTTEARLGARDSLGARYYSPTLGRFMAADWSATPEAVPYANLGNPQSLNLYSYVLNNPVSAADPDGHLVASPAGIPPMGDYGVGIASPDLLAAEAAAESDYLGETVNPVTALIAAQNAARANPAFQPNPQTGETHCNAATFCIAASMGAPMGPLTGPDGEPLLADEIAQNLAAVASDNGSYREVSPMEAQQLANQGKFVVGAWYNPHGEGHVVTVRPEGVPGDKPFGLRGPIVNDIGEFDRVARQSGAFASGKVVPYYTPRVGGGQ